MSAPHTPRRISNALSGRGLHIACVAAGYNADIVDLLVDGCYKKLAALKAPAEQRHCVYVPGALELPVAASWLSQKKGVDAIIALGCVIRGESDHYQFVCENTMRGLTEVSLASGLPVVQALLTVENHEQAMARSGGAYGNKGAEGAETAVAMAQLHKQYK